MNSSLAYTNKLKLGLNLGIDILAADTNQTARLDLPESFFNHTHEGQIGVANICVCLPQYSWFVSKKG
jgi:hypothetical protein